MNEGMPEHSGPVRLRPEMASRRLVVLDFVRRYIERWAGSPSLGEIAAGCGISRSRARQLVQALVRQGMLARKPGPRGLGLPAGLSDDAVRGLREQGWSIRRPCANSPLPGPVVLDYRPGED